MSLSNVSADLIWEITRSQNSYLVKRSSGGGAQFSRDPLNLTNKHSRKAVGVVAGEKGAVVVTTKKAGSITKPSARYTRAFSANKTARKTYKAIARQVANYRPDLLKDAVARASAIRRSQRAVKPEPAQKLRGNAAKKAAASA
ncbi:hypothetical protein N0V85_005140 [Neurospora sp. IMI 360204]|nr:hypothetical protein N0V85_005140 [Neurospora sp. IMI 360204]